MNGQLASSNGLNVYSSTPAQTLVKNGQVTQELILLEQAIQTIEIGLSSLNDRMSPILHPFHSKEVSEDTKDEQIVPIAEGIRINRRKIERLNVVITDILNRIQI